MGIAIGCFAVIALLAAAGIMSLPFAKSGRVNERSKK